MYNLSLYTRCNTQETKKESAKPKSSPKSAKKPVKKEEDDEDKEVSEEELLKQQHQQKRSRTHIDDILQVYEIGSQDVRALTILLQIKQY